MMGSRTGVQIGGLGLQIEERPDRDSAVKSEIIHHRSEIVRLLAAFSATRGARLRVPAVADDSPAQRREKIEKMTAEKKEQLLQREAEFESLSPSKQDRIKKLHEELQSARRRATAAGDASLSPVARCAAFVSAAQLLELAPAERIKRIQEIRKEQAIANAWRPEPKDFEAISHWQDEYAPKYEARLVERLKDDQRQPWEKLDPARRRAHVKWLMVQLSERGRPVRPAPMPAPGEKPRPDERRLPPIGDDELAPLRANSRPRRRSGLQRPRPASNGRPSAAGSARSSGGSGRVCGAVGRAAGPVGRRRSTTNTWPSSSNAT